jgi:hypothetical protein
MVGSVKTGRREIMIQKAVEHLVKKHLQRAKVESRSSDVLEWKVVIVFETTGPHLHPIRLTNAVEKEIQ